MNFTLSCGYPTFGECEKPESYRSVECGAGHVFHIEPRWIGACSGDREDGRERIELISDQELRFDACYKFHAKLRFSQEHRSQERTIFFQLHQYTDKFNHPILMCTIVVDRLVFQPLKDPGCWKDNDQHCWIESGIHRSTLAERSVDFIVSATLQKKRLSQIEVSVGEKQFRFCAYASGDGEPRFKFGLYRMQPKQFPATVDEVRFDNVLVNGNKISVVDPNTNANRIR